MTESTEQFAVAPGTLPGANEDYTAKDLEHLSDQEHVRKRPAMYIGDTSSRGLHHLVSEVVDNSIDEAMAGFASTIVIQINNDGSVTVEDDGRGIPVEEHPELKKSTLEGVMTVLKFGGKFSKRVRGNLGWLGNFFISLFFGFFCKFSEFCIDDRVDFLFRLLMGQSLRHVKD